MNYNYYQRKKSDISYHESKWIKENYDSIIKDEDILFVFQILYEVILVTDKSIYFLNRPTLKKIQYQDITKIKIAGKLLIEIKTKSKSTYTIICVTSVDKGKLYFVLKLILDNFNKKRVTKFEDIDNEFNEFKVLKFPPNQSQHKIPQVYLKQFGYQEKDHWKITIMVLGEKYTRHKSIESFSAKTNVFDIESEDDRFPRMFETMNAEMENLYPAMLDNISTSTKISDEYWEVLIQLVPNLIVRSDFWRDFVEDTLKSQCKEGFLEVTVAVLSKTFEEHQQLKERHFFKQLIEEEFSTSTLNITLILFLNYFCYHLQRFNVIIIKAQEEKPFFTSDNPVNFISNQEKDKLGLFCKNTEVYFPISKDYLAYFYHSNSDKKNFKLQRLNNRNIYNAKDILNEEEYDKLTKEEIIKAADKLVIFPMKFIYPEKK
ncbi:DUF4238 domain-containing protein [Labilibacter sediminis]|nr:DUF4238 domain-containing protein [Labilibacter sediminis]